MLPACVEPLLNDYHFCKCFLASSKHLSVRLPKRLFCLAEEEEEESEEEGETI